MDKEEDLLEFNAALFRLVSKFNKKISPQCFLTAALYIFINCSNEIDKEYIQKVTNYIIDEIRRLEKE